LFHPQEQAKAKKVLQTSTTNIIPSLSLNVPKPAVAATATKKTSATTSDSSSSSSAVLKKKNTQTLLREKAAAAAAEASKKAAALVNVKPKATAPDASAKETQQPLVTKKQEKPLPRPPPSPMDTYELSEREEESDSDESESEDDETNAQPKKRVPEWAKQLNLKKALDIQCDMTIISREQRSDPDTIFGNVFTCDLGAIFGDKKKYNKARKETGDWRRDQVTQSEKQKYKTDMGF
jgi:hypothetical protein